MFYISLLVVFLGNFISIYFYFYLVLQKRKNYFGVAIYFLLGRTQYLYFIYIEYFISHHFLMNIAYYYYFLLLYLFIFSYPEIGMHPRVIMKNAILLAISRFLGLTAKTCKISRLKK